MTIDELTSIFNQAEVLIGGKGVPSMYQYYMFSSQGRSRGVGTIDAREVASLERILEGYQFKEYAPGQIPVFVEMIPINGTVATPSIENS